jgi:hypothetical protein
MYNSYPNQGSSAAKWIFFGFFGIILMGFLLGVNIKDATWLNPNIAREEARRLEIENAHQQATYGLQDAQHSHDLQVLNQDIANRQRWADFMITAATILSIGVGVFAALSIFTLVVAKSVAMVRAVPNATPVIPAPRTVPEIKMIPSVPERQSYEPLDVPQQFVEDPNQQLYDRRVAERFQEVTQQKKEASLLAARMKATIDPARMSSTEYYKQPLAGD